MSLHPQPIPEIPIETKRVTHAALPKGSTITRLRDEFGEIYTDQDFSDLFPTRGQPALAPWRLALITVMQFIENLTDRQAALTVQTRLDWKYALSLELTDAGFDFTVLSEFRARLIQGKAELRLLDKLLDVFKEKGLLKTRGRQRTDSTHVLANVRCLSLIEFIGETLRATLNDLAEAAPRWLSSTMQPEWFDRYIRRVEEYRLPRAKEARAAFANLIGEDGFALLDALNHVQAPVDLRERPMVQHLQLAWTQHFERIDGVAQWRAGQSLPPTSERFASPYDVDAKYSSKRQMNWTGYKVHLSETCDQDSPNIITHVQTERAVVPDVRSTPTIHTALKNKHLLPKEHVVDTGYISVDQINAAAQDEVQLIGPSRPNVSWQAKTPGGLSVDQFQIDWERQKVICPQGKTSVMWSNRLYKSNVSSEDRQPMIQVRFSKTDCLACPVRTCCTRSQRGPRELFLAQKAVFEAGRAARASQSAAHWQRMYDSRAGIEGTISQGVRAFGLRRARYKGLSKVALQEIAVGAAMNVERGLNWVAGVPRLSVKPSRLARLRVVA